ncbi:unnamed protein product [Rhodiola kirilowii]
MSKLAKVEFSPLDISGKNYMPWTIDIEIHLDSMNLPETIIEGNTSSKMDKANFLFFLRRHLNENLKNEYLTVKDPISEYNSEMINLKFCGDTITDAEMMEKTLSTFHASNVTLQL